MGFGWGASSLEAIEGGVRTCGDTDLSRANVHTTDSSYRTRQSIKVVTFGRVSSPQNAVGKLNGCTPRGMLRQLVTEVSWRAGASRALEWCRVVIAVWFTKIIKWMEKWMYHGIIGQKSKMICRKIIFRKFFLPSESTKANARFFFHLF